MTGSILFNFLCQKKKFSSISYENRDLGIELSTFHHHHIPLSNEETTLWLHHLPRYQIGVKGFRIEPWPSEAHHPIEWKIHLSQAVGG